MKLNLDLARLFILTGTDGTIPFQLDDDGSETPLPSSETFSLVPGSYSVAQADALVTHFAACRAAEVGFGRAVQFKFFWDEDPRLRAKACV